MTKRLMKRAAQNVAAHGFAAIGRPFQVTDRTLTGRLVRTDRVARQIRNDSHRRAFEPVVL